MSNLCGNGGCYAFPSDWIQSMSLLLTRDEVASLTREKRLNLFSEAYHICL